MTQHDSLLKPCSWLLQAVEQGNEESSGLGEFYTQQTGHVTEASAQFFQHWLRLIELEEAPLHSKRAEIWVTPGEFHQCVLRPYRTA